jgi:hypothetical protein
MSNRVIAMSKLMKEMNGRWPSDATMDYSDDV